MFPLSWLRSTQISNTWKSLQSNVSLWSLVYFWSQEVYHWKPKASGWCHLDSGDKKPARLLLLAVISSSPDRPRTDGWRNDVMIGVSRASVVQYRTWQWSWSNSVSALHRNSVCSRFYKVSESALDVEHGINISFVFFLIWDAESYALETLF